MITQEQLIEIGYISRLHGLHGEMQAVVSNSIFSEVASCPYFVIELDGIFVPFFLEYFRFKSGSSILFKFEDIDSQEQADSFCGQKLYFDRQCFTKKEAKEYDEIIDEEMGLIGYVVIDKRHGGLGPIVSIDSQTANVLFIIDHKGEELMVPAAEDLIIEIDDEAKTILMDLPEGLVDIDHAMTDM